MSNTSLHKFLVAVSDLAGEHCGRAFADDWTSLLVERDRLLKNSWREIEPASISREERKKLLKEVDFDTLTANAQRYLEGATYPQFLFQVAITAIRYGELEKAHRLLKVIAKKYNRIVDKALLARIHNNLSTIAFYQSDFQAARRELKTGLKLYRELGQVEGIVSVQNRLGTVLIEMGKPEEGKQHFLKAREAAAKAQLTTTLANILMNLGNISNILGEWNEALEDYQNALEVPGDRNDQFSASLSLNMAIVYMKQGNFPKATAMVKASNQYSEQSNLRHERGLSYLVEAEIDCRKRDYSAATALVITAFHLFSEMGDRLRVAEVYRILGMINRDSGHLNQALSYFENSRRINQDLASHLNLGETLFEMGRLFIAAGDKRKAGAAFQSAIKSYKRLNAKSRILEAELALSEL